MAQLVHWVLLVLLGLRVPQAHKVSKALLGQLEPRGQQALKAYKG